MTNEQDTTPYARIARTPSFRKLLEDKRRFLLPISVFFFVFYFALPVMTSYVPGVNRPAIGAITWAWLFAFAQFVMIWTLCALYVRRAAGFDAQVAEIERAEGLDHA